MMRSLVGRVKASGFAACGEANRALLVPGLRNIESSVVPAPCCGRRLASIDCSLFEGLISPEYLSLRRSDHVSYDSTFSTRGLSTSERTMLDSQSSLEYQSSRRSVHVSYESTFSTRSLFTSGRSLLDSQSSLEYQSPRRSVHALYESTRSLCTRFDLRLLDSQSSLQYLSPRHSVHVSCSAFSTRGFCTSVKDEPTLLCGKEGTSKICEGSISEFPPWRSTSAHPSWHEALSTSSMVAKLSRLPRVPHTPPDFLAKLDARSLTIDDVIALNPVEKQLRTSHAYSLTLRDGVRQGFLDWKAIECCLSAWIRALTVEWEILAEEDHQLTQTCSLCKHFTLAARYMVEFLEIHPFRDGNGRVSRKVTAMLLQDSLGGRYVRLPENTDCTPARTWMLHSLALSRTNKASVIPLESVPECDTTDVAAFLVDVAYEQFIIS
ncbi:uncharacterized protein LOC9653009 [Selaginella moellendorffii]|uniref:uncharacterized protein LOC9653009 n=1 Tax=Selaginella moellendorffii TaxID=88036 RepID=UPI000D1C880D|nr:uncharacterized protein LOC9653009 [Selaginella moellendorffii]|eukprot:XP_024515152.1 uncharacterized protein LOC9653009 [Selaginella moellendorffii]